MGELKQGPVAANGSTQHLRWILQFVCFPLESDFWFGIIICEYIYGHLGHFTVIVIVIGISWFCEWLIYIVQQTCLLQGQTGSEDGTKTCVSVKGSNLSLHGCWRWTDNRWWSLHAHSHPVPFEWHMTHSSIPRVHQELGLSRLSLPCIYKYKWGGQVSRGSNGYYPSNCHDTFTTQLKSSLVCHHRQVIKPMPSWVLERLAWFIWINWTPCLALISGQWWLVPSRACGLFPDKRPWIHHLDPSFEAF